MTAAEVRGSRTGWGVRARRAVQRVGLLVGLAAVCACSSSGAPDASTPAPDAAAAVDAGRPVDARVIVADSGALAILDVGPPPACAETCDCPQGLACLDGVCGTAGVGPVYCCTKSGCPGGQVCLGPDDRPSACPGAPDAGVRDAGAHDVGTGIIGSACAADGECGATPGAVCWAQDEPPFLWGGYCTVEDCDFGLPCPTGSTCLTFGAGGPAGCLRDCTTDLDCRTDAYCLAVPGSPIQICFPRCRDDVIDCSPRDGTQFCSPASGRCEPTPAQSATARVGDPCADARDCGAGQVCLGASAWGFGDGMCSRVCDGLPEAAPCEAGETCQDFAGISFCFRDCTNGVCPDRPSARCEIASPAWLVPSCVPAPP
jgi:hypothetical protein